MGDMKIGEGKKYDATQVSSEGLSQEEIAEITKKNKRLIKIFQAYDTDGKAGLSSTELAAAMDDFIKAAGEDNKISEREFKKMAENFNHWNELSGGKEVSGEDLENFMKAVRKATKKDEKVSTQQLLEERQKKAEAQLRQIEEARRQEEMQERARLDAQERSQQILQEYEAEQKAKAEREAEQARIKDLQTPKIYTVQENESFKDLIKRSLAAQGIENPTDEQMKEAIAKFKKDNPGAVHRTKKGVEYLYAGAEVKIAGNLEDKGNSEEIEANALKRKADAEAAAAEEARIAAEEKEKQEKGLPPYAPKEQEYEMPDFNVGFMPLDGEFDPLNPPFMQALDDITPPETPDNGQNGQDVNPPENQQSTPPPANSGVLKLKGADPETGKWNNKNFANVQGHGMCRYNEALKGYEPYNGTYDGKYYENGQVKNLATKTLVDFDRESKIRRGGVDFADKYPSQDYRKYNTYQYRNGSLTPLYRDPTYDSNVQIKIGDTTYELAKGKGGYAHWDFKDFLEDFVDQETGAIRADRYVSNTYYLRANGDEGWIPVKIDRQTKALMVEINGQKYDMNDLMTGKVKI